MTRGWGGNAPVPVAAVTVEETARRAEGEHEVVLYRCKNRVDSRET